MIPHALPGPSPEAVRPAGVWWAWRPLHGGCGVSTLSQAIPGGTILTEDPRDLGWPELPVVAVARSHASGLLAAQRFAAEIAAEPRVRLLGLMVVADAPRRLPGLLETTLRLVEGGYPQVWRAAWVEGWRRGQPVTPRSIPRSYGLILIDLMDRTGMRPPTADPPAPALDTDGTDGTDSTETKETVA